MKKLHVGVGTLVLVAMLGLVAWRPTFIERLEYQLYDWRFRLRGAETPRSPVAIVAIDARSVDALGRWPWRRSVMARLVDRLTEAGVTAIGFDIVFSEPETPPEIGPLRDAAAKLATAGTGERVREVLDAAIDRADTDGQLEEAIRRSDRVVMGYFFRTPEDSAVEGENVDLPLDVALPLVRKSRVATRVPPEMKPAPILACSSVEPNIPRFSDATRRMGFFNARPDPDGVVRRAPLLAFCGGDFYKSLSLSLYELAVGHKSALIWDETGFYMRGLEVADTRIPVDEGGRVLVNYRGPPRTFPHIPAIDVLEGRVPREELADRIVIVGPTEVGIQDVYASPFTNVAPGVEVHATLLDNMLTGEVLHESGFLTLIEVGLVLGLGLVSIAGLTWIRRALPGLVFSALLLAGLVGGVVWAFLAWGVVVNLAYPALTLVLLYGAMTVTRLASEEAQARWIRNTFATFVPPDVVDEMIAHPEAFVVGGQRKDLSLLFSDIRGFTTLSEELGPEGTTRLLNDYLTPMTRILFESRGTLDKYIGDAVVAFWGAPLPVPDHPLRAAEAAIAMQASCAVLREERSLPGADRLRIGIGIHSAEVNVGKMGSELRFDYTVSGDGVNLCSRLEGLTKQYGVGIIASEALVERLPEGFLTRPLDRIRVKGKHEPVAIVELLGRRAPEGTEKDWLDAYAAGLAAYRAGRWDEAERALREVGALRPQGDRAAELLLERIGRLRADPPSGWDGVWAFETK